LGNAGTITGYILTRDNMDAIIKLHAILYMAYQIEKDLVALQKNYHDLRGNLDKSAGLAGDIITRIEGHLKDIQKGVE
jgi:hypothetical protein